MGEFLSGQREQTVNLSSVTSVVRIHPLPPKLKTSIILRFLIFVIISKIIVKKSGKKKYIRCMSYDKKFRECVLIQVFHMDVKCAVIGRSPQCATFEQYLQGEELRI